MSVIIALELKGSKKMNIHKHATFVLVVVGFWLMIFKQRWKTAHESHY